MKQDHSYPDPEQLKTFCREPMPFHDVKPHDLELIENDFLRYGVENVEYRWAPEYVKVETEADEWTTAEQTEHDPSHEDAWDLSDHTSIEEDFVTARWVPWNPDLWQAEAVWILDTITITREE